MSSVTLYAEVIDIIKRQILSDDCVSDQKVLDVATDSSGAYSMYGWICNATTVDLMQEAYEAGLRYRNEQKITITEKSYDEDEDEE